MEFKKIHMIHAASASGKTTYLKRGKAITLDQTPTGDDDLVGYSNGPFLLVDGDHLVSFYSSWPSAAKWWQSEARTIAHSHMYATIMTAAVKLILKQDFKVMVILFNGGMSSMREVEELYVEHSDGISDVSHSVVEIDEDLHKEYVQSRLDEKGIKTTIQAQEQFVFPASWRDAENNRSASRALAEEYGFKVFTSFSEALSKLAIDAKLDEPVQNLEPSEREIFQGVTPTGLTVKLSYKNGILSGTETYQARPTVEYWTKNYPELKNAPREFEFTENTYLPMKNDEYLLVWIEADGFDAAVEITGRKAAHFPQKEMTLADVEALAVEPTIKEIVPTGTPIKSEDGVRTYSTEESMEKEHLNKLNQIFVDWPFEEGLEALKLKLVEETEELLEGGDEGIEREGNDISVIGTSALSESITVAIICAKLAHMHGVQAWEFMNLMFLRHKEQFDRYN